jgi:lipopolysaccharide export system protein LptA
MAAGVAACTAGAFIDAQAQTPASEDVFGLPPEAKDFLGLLQNRGKPLEIEAALAEPEAGGVERYGGNGSWVNVKLGGTTLESHFVTVYYERSPATAGVSTAELRKAGLTHILKLEASGDVLLTYQDQTAAGDKAVFYIRENKVWFIGNVAFTQKQNVIKGGTLLANLTTGYVAIASPPRRVLKGPYPPVFETWGVPKPKDAR